MSTPLRIRLTIFREILLASTLTRDTPGKQAVSRVLTALKFLLSRNGFDLHRLFCARFYLEQNQDVAEAQISPLAHYLRSGAREGRDPHPLFSSSYYLERNPDVAENGINPLVHYICAGAKEGRDPHPLFSSSYYREQSPDVAEKGINPLVHYIGVGAKEGRDPHPIFNVAYYVERRPDLKQKGINPLIHYISFGLTEGQDPHPLFSSSYYFEQRSDLQGKANPLIHYIRYGAAEGRDPHPLFSSAYYLAQNADARESGSNPLAHYLRFGQFESRRPHPLIDPDFYYATQPDVFRENPGMLTHYLQCGSAQRRPPTPAFDPAYYLAVHQDAADAGVEPFTHYVRWGIRERRSTREPRFESGIADNYFPATKQNSEHPPAHLNCIDVIIPVYKGLRDTQTCLASVLTAHNTVAFNVVVINDNSPEIQLRDYLREVAEEGKIHLIEHDVNLGFVASANEGMSLHPERDVVLLNSDTEVFHNWLDRLASHAYSSRVGSVTPFSNNATICSYPKLGEDNSIPKDTTAEELDRLMHRVNAGRHCAIPTAIGFCMYIRRECLNEIGVFDETAFGRGYGEENDFCMRALKQGWTHLLAADVFVYHAGSVSFGPSTELQRSAMKTLLSKHPRYMDYVGWHCQTNPANAFRIAATVDRLRRSHLPIWMNVLHSWGGGTLEHVQQLENITQQSLVWLRLEAAGESRVRLSCEQPGFEFSVILHAQHDYDLLVRLLRQIGIARIHVHHIIGVPIDLKRLAADLDVAYDVTLHDYYFVCPNINLVDDRGRYCGEPDDGACRRCIEVAAQGGLNLDILSWRAKHGMLLAGAARVIAPSGDTAKRFQHYFPWLPITAAWHEVVSAPLAIAKLTGNLRVAVIGMMTAHKGLANLSACSQLAQTIGAPVEFLHIGSVEPESDSARLNFRSTGRYQPGELTTLLSRYQPHIVWFPCQWPETFSYTLSRCLSLGLPVAVPNLGAFAERVAGREWSWVLPWDTRPEEWLQFFVRIRKEHFAKQVPPPVLTAPCTAEKEFYPDSFVRPPKVARRPSRPSDKRRSLLALASSFANGQIQACGYVRIVQPLTHPSIASQLSFRLVDYDGALAASPDVLIVQRIAVIGEERAERLIDHCRRHRIRLVYEIDDDLFRLPAEHPEYHLYALDTRAARLIARTADAITVSTEPLRLAMRRYNDRVLVIPNAVDERLWSRPKASRVRETTHKIRALYMGGISHQPDLAMLETSVRRLKQDFDFQLDVIGVTSEPGPSPWFRCIPVPGDVSASYRRFAEWLQSEGTWNFALAPLLESRFNASKSPIKVYEYASLKLPTVASDVCPYKHVIKNAENGLLALNTDEDWYDSLRLLCESRVLLKRLAAGASAAQAHWTLGANGQQLREAWEAALFGATPVQERAFRGEADCADELRFKVASSTSF
jgi:GT2 family glycosyltransferase/glycosyltransferase involved in cell wall biosynthesis